MKLIKLKNLPCSEPQEPSPYNPLSPFSFRYIDEDKAKRLFNYFNNELQLGYHLAKEKAAKFCDDMIEEDNKTYHWEYVKFLVKTTSYGE